MAEMTKTLIYVGIALAVGVLAVVTRPKPPGVEPREEIGAVMFPEFTDPLTARSMEILRYDEDLAEIERFKVAEIDGVWSIPSHQNYPADAEDQVRDAATLLIDLEVLGIASDVAIDHRLFGVVEPDKEKVEPGEKGVGLWMKMQYVPDKDEKGERSGLAQLIVGGKVKGTDDQRFVRIPGRDRVYVAKIDTGKLSTKFEDWIEEDLLKLNTWDIEQVVLNDYSVQTAPTLAGRLAVTSYDQRLAMTLSLDNSDWKLEELIEWRQGQKMQSSLMEDEELDDDRLSDLKNALDDLKIVDVERKPKGLGADLRADKDFLNNNESLKSLILRGFYPVNLGGGNRIELLSSDGEVIIRTEDGVEYILRFGQIAGMEEGGDEGDEDDDEGKLNRYLFVTARVWDEKVPKSPEEVPAGPEQEKDTASKPEEAASDAGQDADQDAGQDGGQDADQGGSGDGDSGEEESDKDDEKSEEQKKLEQQKEKREEAEKKVRELNDRFADWYYVISEDVYKKIHLGRADVIKEKEDVEEEGYGIDALRKLQEEGVEKEEE